MARYQSTKTDQIVLWYKNITFSHSLRGVELAYSGSPRVDASKVEELTNESYIRGRQSATDELNQQILSNRTEVQQLIGETLVQMDQRVEQCMKEVFDEIPALVTNIARRVLADIEIDGEAVKAIVDDLISDLPTNKESIEIFLNPKDLSLLKTYVENMRKAYPHCEFLEDVSLNVGDCRVESNFGSIDGTMETKLKHIEEQLKS